MYKQTNFIYTILFLLILNSCGTSNNISSVHYDSETNPILSIDYSNTKIPIWIIGDSTVTTYTEKDSRKGWGQMIKPMFKNPLRVENRARAGASSKSFKPTLQWDGNFFWGNGISHTSIREGNQSGLMEDISQSDTSNGALLIIQFGHNDVYTKDYNASKCTVPGLGNEFDIQLMEYIHFAKKHNVTPILVTPMVRMFHSSLSESYAHVEKKLSNNTPPPWEDMRGKKGDWPQTIRDIAKRENLILIDLTKKSKEHFTRDFISNQAIKDAYSWNGKDFTHFNRKGAQKMADFIKELSCDIEKVQNTGLCNQFRE